MSAPDVNYAAEYAAIIAEAGSGREVLPTGTYTVRVAQVKEGKTSTGKLSVGIMFVVQDPASQYNGKSTWVNLYLTPKDEGAVAYGIYVRQLLSFLPQSILAAGPKPQELHTYIKVGTVGKASLKSKPWNGEEKQDLGSFSLSTGAPAVSSTPKPASAAPVAVAVPVSVPVPAAPVVDEVAALKAQLAALTAPAAVVEPQDTSLFDV